MGWLEKLGAIDRRIIYLLLALAVTLPLVFPFALRQHVDRSTRGVFEAVDRIPAGGPALLISFDYPPDLGAELDPMALTVLRHCFARGVRVVGLSLVPTGAAVGERIMRTAAAEYGRRYGTDYCYFGYRPNAAVIMQSIGVNAKDALPADNQGTPYDSIPLMRTVRNYDDVALIFNIAGSGTVSGWVTYAGGPFRVAVAAGVASVMAPDFIPYLQTGQLVGQLGGMKGAAEYEQLVADRGYAPSRGTASRAMNAITATHLLVMALIVIGNAAFFAARSRRRRPHPAEAGR
ncbi:MAG TPA: hypothetical protein VMF29_00685 [Candidatus Edwardsbacteria bacterium]|nr:hypothetical protein [Candidatus Edwardsbacteria bacterium]